MSDNIALEKLHLENRLSKLRNNPVENGNLIRKIQRKLDKVK